MCNDDPDNVNYEEILILGSFLTTVYLLLAVYLLFITKIAVTPVPAVSEARVKSQSLYTPAGLFGDSS